DQWIDAQAVALAVADFLGHKARHMRRGKTRPIPFDRVPNGVARVVVLIGGHGQSRARSHHIGLRAITKARGRIHRARCACYKYLIVIDDRSHRPDGISRRNTSAAHRYSVVETSRAAYWLRRILIEHNKSVGVAMGRDITGGSSHVHSHI